MRCGFFCGKKCVLFLLWKWYFSLAIFMVLAERCLYRFAHDRSHQLLEIYMSETCYLNDVLVSLRRIIRSTDLHSKRMIRECGLTTPQVMILKAIEELGDVTVRKISDHVLLSQATVTTILNRLEQRGYIERVRSLVDRRIVNARLTETGHTVLEQAPTLLHDKFIERFDALDPWEKTQLLSSLQRVASMMDAETIDAAPLLDIETPPV